VRRRPQIRDQRGNFLQLEEQIRRYRLSEAKRLQQLYVENRKLKKLLAERPSRKRRHPPIRSRVASQAESAGDSAGQQVPVASAAEPAKHDLCSRGNRDRRLDASDPVGACVVALDPLVGAIRTHLLGAEASMLTTRQCLNWRG
jgi:hypothetical protein